MFHVKHGGMAELWGRQFEKYHFSPTRYRGVSVSRETWVRDVLGLGRCVYGKLGCFVLFGFMMEAYSVAGETWFGWWLVEHYFSYHVDCPDGCGLGEPARGG